MLLDYIYNELEFRKNVVIIIIVVILIPIINILMYRSYLRNFFFFSFLNLKKKFNENF